jgi:hypothetical protein
VAEVKWRRKQRELKKTGDWLLAFFKAFSGGDFSSADPAKANSESLAANSAVSDLAKTKPETENKSSEANKPAETPVNSNSSETKVSDNNEFNDSSDDGTGES